MKILQTLVYSLLTLLIFSSLTFAQNLYIYPVKGQSQFQMDKDTDWCHIWAVDQTKFDPTASYTPSSSGPRQPTPRSGVLAGAFKGTILGAVVGAIRGDIGRDIAIGASSGAILGAFNKYDERKNRKYYQKQYEEQQKSEFVAKKTNYNRAYTVCLTGRGYTVK